MKIILKPIGKIEKRIVDDLKQRLGSIFGCPVVTDANIDIPDNVFNRKREQYLAPLILDYLSKNMIQSRGEKILGIVDIDIHTPGSNYVFGLADPIRDIALISLCRLRQELPPDYDLLIKRTTIEAVHELGHTLGINHCSNSTCVMHLSNSLHDTDLKGTAFCSNCQPKLIK